METLTQDKKKSSSKPVYRPAVRLLIQNFFDHNASKNAASLAYDLLFALFPLLIFTSNLLGLLDLNINAIVHSLQQFLPRDIVEYASTSFHYF